MVQVNTQIKISKTGKVDVDIDLLKREDAIESENKIAEQIEIVISRYISELAKALKVRHTKKVIK